MATSTSTPKRAQPATHPTVWVGLLLAVVGLLLAMYSYTGARVYDVTFAFVALGGGVLALSGILVAAWGRAVMASRAQRARRTAAKEAVEKNAEAKAAPSKERSPFRIPVLGKREKAQEPAEEAPPTVAAPAGKRRVQVPSFLRRGAKEERQSEGNLFSFRRRQAAAAEGADATAHGAAANGAPAAPQEAPAPAAEPAPGTDPTADGAVVRITLRCPQCTTQFAAEGVQPIAIACPSCGLSGTV